MRRLVVMLPEDRGYAGVLQLEDGHGAVVAGPFAVCGRADEAAAQRHGNPNRNSLLPFGDTPLGRYRIEGILPSGPGTKRPANNYGPHGVVVLKPTSGDAALADANGRFHLLIQGGTAGPGRHLRLTNGSLRLGNREQKRLIEILRDCRGIICELLPMPNGAATRPIALDSACSESDPPLAAEAVASAIASPQFPGTGLHSRFAPPSFNLLPEGGGGGGGGDDGYGFTADDLTSAAKDLAKDHAADYARDADGQTHCSEFVRDFATKIVGSPLPELEGTASDQVDAMATSKDFDEIKLGKDPQKAFDRAQEAANDGKLVIVGWKNPKPTAKDSGHVATVVPSKDAMPASKKWGNLKMPYIAQAGSTVSDKTTLNYGFGSDKKAGLRIFIRKR